MYAQLGWSCNAPLKFSPQLIGGDSGAGQESKCLLPQTQKTRCAQPSTKNASLGELRRRGGCTVEALFPEGKTRNPGRPWKVGETQRWERRELIGTKPFPVLKQTGLSYNHFLEDFSN